MLDLQEWVGERLCSTQAAYDALTPPELSSEARSHAENRLIVLSTFERQFTVEENGEDVSKTTMGMIFSTKALLERLRLLVERGQRIAIQVRARAPARLSCLPPY